MRAQGIVEDSLQNHNLSGKQGGYAGEGSPKRSPSERGKPKIALEHMRIEPEIRKVGINRKGEDRTSGKWDRVEET